MPSASKRPVAYAFSYGWPLLYVNHHVTERGLYLQKPIFLSITPDAARARASKWYRAPTIESLFVRRTNELLRLRLRRRFRLGLPLVKVLLDGFYLVLQDLELLVVVL